MAKLQDFKPQRKNANKHTPRGMKLLEDSIQQGGWIGAITSSADGEVFAGSARLEKIGEVMPNDPLVVHTTGDRPVIVVRDDIPNADDPRAVRLALADNRIQQVDLDYDTDMLAEIREQDASLLENLWYENELVDLGVMEAESKDAEPQVDRAAELLEKWQVKTGDLWQIGDHRLICGDCTDPAVVARVMGGERADMVFTDPPYGIEYDNAKRWEGLKKQSEGAAISRGPMIEGDDKEFDPSFILSGFSYCKEIFLWGMQYYLGALPNGGVIVWNRKSVEQKDLPFADFELCWSKQQRHKMAWITWGGWKSKEKGEERLHTTQKPVELAEWFIAQWSKEGNIVFDGYAGSGFTLVACENTGRMCRAADIDAKYVAVTLERMATAFPALEIARIL